MATVETLPKSKQITAATGLQSHMSNGTSGVTPLKGADLPGNDGEPQLERERFQGNLGLAYIKKSDQAVRLFNDIFPD